jgi:RNA recognition motif-containing protein
MTKLYVGNLSFSMTERDLHELFSQAGEVESARIITDRDTGRSRGFGFVEYKDSAAAESAIKQFNGYQVAGRELTVNEAKPQVPRSGGGGGKGGWGRGGHRGGGGGGGRRGGYDRF